MALHDRDSVRDQLEDDVYASADLSANIPKYKFPAQEHEAGHAYSLVHDELMLDGNSRQNLATFCQTWVEPEVHQLMDACLDKNMVDKDEYPQTAEIEARCVHMLADLWNVACRGERDRVFDDRFERGRDAWRDGDEAVAGRRSGGRRASRWTSRT